MEFTVCDGCEGRFRNSFQRYLWGEEIPIDINFIVHADLGSAFIFPVSTNTNFTFSNVLGRNSEEDALGEAGAVERGPPTLDLIEMLPVTASNPHDFVGAKLTFNMTRMLGRARLEMREFSFTVEVEGEEAAFGQTMRITEDETMLDAHWLSTRAHTEGLRTAFRAIRASNKKPVQVTLRASSSASQDMPDRLAGVNAAPYECRFQQIVEGVSITQQLSATSVNGDDQDDGRRASRVSHGAHVRQRQREREQPCAHAQH